jgi:hypothetical protein
MQKSLYTNKQKQREIKMTTSLIHTNPDLSDEALAKEAEVHLAKSATLQAMVQILEKQRKMLLQSAKEDPTRQLGWLTLAELRKAFPATMRMQALSSRPDIRQRITTELTGLRPKASRGKNAEFQADLIDSTIDDGDIGLQEFEIAFDLKDLVTYMDVSSFWKFFMDESLARIIEENSSKEKELFAFLLDAFLQSRDPLKPILTHLDVRAAIQGEIWQQRIPLGKRVAVDTARLAQERKTTSQAFTAKQEIDIVTLEVIVELDLSDLVPILRAAGKAMDLEGNPNESNTVELIDEDDIEVLSARSNADATDSSPDSDGDNEKKG